MVTAKKHKTDMFDVLVNCPRVDLDVKDKNGDTAAMWALKNNNPEALKKILKTSMSEQIRLLALDTH